jgi:gas vesicle protein
LDPEVQDVLAEEQIMSNKLTTLGFFAAGIGIGAAAALLYAPRAGRHTRARLRNSANRTLHRVEEVQNDVRACVSELVDDASEVIAANLASGKDAAKASKERVLHTFDKVRECVDEGREKVEQYIRAVAT